MGNPGTDATTKMAQHRVVCRRLGMVMDNRNTKVTTKMVKRMVCGKIGMPMDSVNTEVSTKTAS